MKRATEVGEGLAREDRGPRSALRRELPWDLVAAGLGVAAFLYFCGPRILAPGHTGWLLQNTDPAQHYLSWQLFRESPLAQFPLGMNPRFGSAMRSSVVYSDSLPLLALPLKYARSLLPPVFQYHGAWILGCLILQGVAARRLFARFIDERPQQLLGAAFFVLSPSLLFRLNGHYSLLAHWLLVSGLVLYFSSRYRRVAWVALLSVAALVHAYLLVLAAGIWVADIVARGRGGEARWVALLRDLFLGAVVVVACMAVAGYFVGGVSVGATGFGSYRMNLLAPFDPHEAWSRLLPALVSAPGEYEGFNFLGTGVLILAAAVLGSLGCPARRTGARRPYAPLACLAGLLLVYALSNRIYLGEIEVLSYHVPSELRGVTSAFRASGRMFWPVVYLIDLLVIVQLVRRWNRRFALAALAATLALQTADLSAAAAGFREQFARGESWSTPLVSPFWDLAADRYDKVVIVPAGNDPEGFVALAHFAATHSMSINSGYYSRIDEVWLRREARRERARLELGTVDPGALYVFRRRDELWTKLRATRAAPDFVGSIDGYAVFAPLVGPIDPSWFSADETGKRERHRRERSARGRPDRTR